MTGQCTSVLATESLPSHQACPTSNSPEPEPPLTTLTPVSLTGTSSVPDLQQPTDPVQSQPKPALSAPASDKDGDKDVGQSRTGRDCCGTEEDCCGVCRHLFLALVLVVFSPVIAVGVCVADVVTGECCKVYDNESEVDTEEDY